MSKVILAHLPSHRLQNIFLRRQEEISDAHLGQKWDEFRDLLANIRSDGYVKSAGEFTPEVAGIAAPIFNAEQAVIGSVGIAMDMSELSDLDLDRAILSVKRAGRTISSRMASGNAGPVLGPRAVG